MRDDAHLDNRITLPCSNMPSWYGEKAAGDPIKEAWAKLDCPQCGRYCIIDYFHVEFQCEMVGGLLKRKGNGHLLEGKDFTFANIMRCTRNGAYYFWEQKLKKLLPHKHQHGYINECILHKVRNCFPDPEGNYEGYQYTLAEYKALVAESESNDLDEEWLPDPNIPIEENSSSDENLEWHFNI